MWGATHYISREHRIADLERLRRMIDVDFKRMWRRIGATPDAWIGPNIFSESASSSPSRSFSSSSRSQSSSSRSSSSGSPSSSRSSSSSSSLSSSSRSSSSSSSSCYLGTYSTCGGCSLTLCSQFAVVLPSDLTCLTGEVVYPRGTSILSVNNFSGVACKWGLLGPSSQQSIDLFYGGSPAGWSLGVRGDRVCQETNPHAADYGSFNGTYTPSGVFNCFGTTTMNLVSSSGINAGTLPSSVVVYNVIP